MAIAALVGFVWTSNQAATGRRQIAHEAAQEQCKNASDSDCQQLFANLRSAAASEASADAAEQQLWMNLFALLGLVATVAYARRAWIASRDSAEAANKALRHTEVTAERQLRAYIGLEGGHLKIFSDEGRLQAEIRFKNSGATPAYNTRLRGGMFIAKHPDGEFLFRDLADHIAPPTVISPGGSFEKTESGKTLAQRLADLKDNKEIIFVYGYITYDDAFGRPHFTNYRMYCGGDHPNWLTKRNGIEVGRFAAAAEGNECD